MVYTEHVETAAVSCGTSHVTTKQHCKYSTWVDIENRAIQKVTVTHFESHVTKAQRINWRVKRYIKVIIIIIIKGQWSAREQKSQHWPVWPLGSQFQPHVSLYHPAKAREKVCPVQLLCNKTCNSQSMLRPHFPIIQPRPGKKSVLYSFSATRHATVSQCSGHTSLSSNQGQGKSLSHTASLQQDTQQSVNAQATSLSSSPGQGKSPTQHASQSMLQP